MTRRTWERLWTTAALLSILWAYHWTLGSVSGLGPPSPTAPPNDYYNHLVGGFLHGHLYMDVPVPDALKALRDPYDPNQNRGIGLIDTSYYQGHYYLYFGPTPAVTLMLPFRVLTGRYLPTPWTILVFSSFGFLAASGLWLAVRRRYFADSPTWTAPVGVLVLGIGSLTGLMLRRPFFWELAVAGGFAFAMLALAAVYRAIHDERRPALWMTLGGLCLGLAAASRPTYLFAAPILLVPLLVKAEAPLFTSRRWRMAIGGGLGFGAIFAAMLAYNYGRYGNPLEFGHNYLLSVAYESKVHLFRLRHLWFNLRMYYLLPGHWSWHPPFFAPAPVLPNQWPPGFYTVDDVFGLIPVFPIAIAALVAPFAILRRAPAKRARLVATLAAIALLFAAGAGVVLLYVATIPRYAVDFQPALMLLATIGVLALVELARRTKFGRALQGLIGAIAVFSIIVGSIAVFDVGRGLQHTNPAAVRRLDALTSGAERWVDAVRRVHYGPVEMDVRFPPTPKPHVETLLESGDPARPDRVLVEYRSPTAIRLGVQPADSDAIWSRTIAINPTAAHHLRINLGSFYPPLEHHFFAHVDYLDAARASSRADLVLDGNPVLEAYAPFSPSHRGTPRHVAAEFSGTATEIRPVTAELGPVRPLSDTLLLSFKVPPAPQGRRLPLIASGQPGAADLLFLEFTSASEARLGYDHWGSPLIWSEAFALSPDQPHRIELRQTELGWAAPHDGNRELVAWVDGHLRYHASVPAFHCGPDEVYFGRNDAGHTTAEPIFPGLETHTTTPEGGPPGGVLLLRLVLPPPVKGAWQPILSTGRTGAADVLSLFYIDRNIVQFRFDHTGAAIVLGKAITVGGSAGHDIEIEYPSFATKPFGQTATGDVVVRCDGDEVLRAHTGAFAFDRLVLGRNPYLAFMDDTLFRGCFVGSNWLENP